MKGANWRCQVKLDPLSIIDFGARVVAEIAPNIRRQAGGNSIKFGFYLANLTAPFLLIDVLAQREQLMSFGPSSQRKAP